MDKITESLGRRIAAARKTRSLSQRQLAALVNVEPNTISMYESGVRKPSTDVIIRLARTLHVSTDYLLLGDRKNSIDISGLSPREANLLYDIAEAFRARKE